MQIRKVVVDNLTRQYRLEKLQIRNVVVDNLTRQDILEMLFDKTIQKIITN